MNAAILFEPDGYLLTGPRLMGRQAAGNGFLRAAVHARGDQPLACFTPLRESALTFRETVMEIDPAATMTWIPSQRLELVAQAGVLYRPDQIMGIQARQRLRAGPAAYSLCGVTHTLATSGTLDNLGRILTDPVMPWDALVCTSTAALGVVETVLDRQADYLAWQTGQPFTQKRPMLPVIPLGVHCDDFAFTDPERQAARESLGLSADDVAVLFAGRLSVSGKSHPYAMFKALQTVAEQTGKAIVLLLAGQAYSDKMAELFTSGLSAFCPGVRTVFVDGKDAQAYRSAWAGADLFVSLADSIQETFGITPLEAMAAGLPALVSDWNGYKDTVRDGLDGFRIRTWAPSAEGGEVIAAAFEAGALGYDQYLSRSNTAVSIDVGQLTARLRDLVSDPALRRRLGAAGQARARRDFDWAVVFRRYQALWDEQTAVRRKAAADPDTADWLAHAPKSGSDFMSPFETFAGYPSEPVTADTLVTLSPGATGETYGSLIGHPVMALWTVSAELVGPLLGQLAAGPRTVEALAAACEITPLQVSEIAARLAKMDLVVLGRQA